MVEELRNLDPSVFNEIKKIIDTIPFDTLTLGKTPMTHRLAWRGPAGFGFKVTGCFITSRDGSHTDYQYSWPEFSAELCKYQFADKYNRLLVETDGDENEALDMLLDDEFDSLVSDRSPDSFLGRWLVLSNNPNSNDAETLPVQVEGDIHAWYETEDYVGQLDDISSEAVERTRCVFVAPVKEVFWKQDTATAALGGCIIELVELPEPESELFIPPKLVDPRLWLPESMENQYPNELRYLPTITTLVTPRQPTLVEGMTDPFKNNREYFLYLNGSGSLFLAFRKLSEIIMPENKPSPLIHPPKDKYKHDTAEF